MKTFTNRHFIKALLLSIIIFTAFPSDILLATGFKYHFGHPSPQGNTVYGIAFSDENQGWAVTGCGSILMTTDGGLNWSMASGPDSLCNDLYDILISEQGTLIASGDNGRIMRSTDNAQSWQMNDFPGSGRLYDLALIPGGGISAAGENGSVLISFDDGINWVNKGPGGSGYARSIYWKSAVEGYVVGQGLFHRTLDGGNTWSQVATPGFFGLNEVYFVNENTGYALEDFAVWKTTDGGNSWTSNSQFNEPLYRFRTVAIDELHWFSVVNGEGVELWETLDAGSSWQKKYDYNSTGSPCLVRKGSRLLFGSDIGDIFYTDDNGTTTLDAVQNLAVFPSAPVTVIGMRPDGTLFANNQPNSGTNNGTFFRSDDFGMSWYLPSPSPGLRWITDICFYDNQYGIVGSYADVRYTTDGGESWNISTLPTGYNLTNFALPAGNNYFAGSYASYPSSGGNLYRSADHGASWEAVGGGLPVGQIYLSNVSFANENEGYIVGQLNSLIVFYKTTDAGVSWTQLNQTGIPGFVSDMIWMDGNTGLAAVPNATAGGIYRTTDGGLNWTRVSTTRGRKFSQSPDGMIAAVYAGDAAFQESADGGLSWSTYTPPFSSSVSGYSGKVQSIQATADGYILGGTGNKLMRAERIIETGSEETETADIPASVLTISPNPVRDHATIRFYVNSDGTVQLNLVDPRGSLIRTILQEKLPAGRHTFDLDLSDITPKIAAGVYFITLSTKDRFSAERIVLTR